jgi:ubiquinone/menaquinone biosynthesis C-methylase UbiE
LRDDVSILLPPALMSSAAKATLDQIEEEEEFAGLKRTLGGVDAPDNPAVAEDKRQAFPSPSQSFSTPAAAAPAAAAILRTKAAEITQRDRLAERYDEIFDAAGLRSEEAALLRWSRPAAPEVVLDLGCGTGRFTVPLARRARFVVGVDFSFASLLILRRRLREAGLNNVFLLCADAAKIPLADGLFDVVLSAQLLEHVPGDEGRRAVLAETARLLKPGGRAVFDFYNWSFLQPRFTRRTQRVKAGLHGEAIPFYRMQRDEFFSLVETVNELRLRRFSGVRSLTMFNLDRRLSRLKWVGPACAVEALLTASRLARWTGYCLLAEMRKIDSSCADSR